MVDWNLQNSAKMGSFLSKSIANVWDACLQQQKAKDVCLKKKEWWSPQ